ncbi:MAG: hypothetical protein WAW39_30105 [Prosthecobacter sp.]|uniref:hypothetical protein n=1 Tax=Prosthecobacter sp. TaxID=1965333 RepID=UPI003BB07463
MKTKLIHSTILVLATFATMLLASCAPPSATPTSAISCTKCGTVYFKTPSLSASSPGGKGFVTLRSSSSMTCPDCENKVIAWVKTGSFTQHVCKTCGGAMSHCTSH